MNWSCHVYMFMNDSCYKLCSLLYSLNASWHGRVMRPCLQRTGTFRVGGLCPGGLSLEVISNLWVSCTNYQLLMEVVILRKERIKEGSRKIPRRRVLQVGGGREPSNEERQYRRIVSMTLTRSIVGRQARREARREARRPTHGSSTTMKWQRSLLKPGNFCPSRTRTHLYLLSIFDFTCVTW